MGLPNQLASDLRTDWKLTKVCPDLADRWKLVRAMVFKTFGKQIRVTEGLRSFADQWELWGKGRQKDSGGSWSITNPQAIVTHAMAGESLHQYGLAIDSCFMDEDDPYLCKISGGGLIWDYYGLAVRANGLTWGGDWKGSKQDRPHCEITYGMSIHTIQMVYEDCGIGALWQKCLLMMRCGGKVV